MERSKWEGGGPKTFSAESEQARGILAFDDELSVEALKAVEQTLFNDPRNEPAIRLLACHVRQIGERLLALEAEYTKMVNTAFPR